MNTKAFLFAITTSLIWGFAPIFDKIGVKDNPAPLASVCFRAFSVGVFSLILLIATQNFFLLKEIPPKNLLFVVLGGLCGGLIGVYTYFIALKHGDASIVVPLCATYPLVTMLFSFLFLNEPVTVSKAVGILLIVLGVLLLK